MADSGRINAIIARAVTVLLDDSRFGPRLSNCWLPASTWAEALTKSGHIEYSWAHAKAYYRRVPVSRKRGRENFKDLVKECTSPVKVLTKARIEKFASRARAYICTFHHLEQMQSAHAAAASTGVDPVAVFPKQVLLYSEIERVKKDFNKCHRCALDFDRGFVN